MMQSSVTYQIYLNEAARGVSKNQLDSNDLVYLVVELLSRRVNYIKEGGNIAGPANHQTMGSLVVFSPGTFVRWWTLAAAPLSFSGH
jgi:hypothetical protein